ncbi:restriction endonuclease subunit S [uncultured Phascolarctobacterium sp.]|uniref:restriction endonuclease subunit S n=1 Tax=uncultured Phascolarctobacterium sp. TaxID=512296 RepID=UPI0025FB3ADE|nr:restriction endonuclease subunit S [uncultured Phascolarctobacterium sp.]
MSHKYVLLKEVCEKASSNIAQKDLAECDGIYPIYGASGYIKSVDFFQQAKDYIAIVKDGAGIGRAMKLPAKSSVIGTMQYVLPNDNINISYLYYAICSMHLEKYFSGATIPHIYFRDYQNEQLPLPTLEEQAKIANVFGRIDYFIKKEKEQLINLDKLVKSRFVELFLQANESFPKKKLGECTVINPKKSMDTRLKEDLIVSFVPMASVGEDGSIDTSEKKLYREVKSGFTYFIEGDVLFAKITPCMENGKGAVAINLYNGIGFGSTEFHVIRPLEGFTNPVWLYNLSVSKKFRLEAEANMTGSAGQKRTPASFLQNYEIKLPPIELQNQFADFAEQVDKSKFVVTAKFQ